MCYESQKTFLIKKAYPVELVISEPVTTVGFLRRLPVDDTAYTKHGSQQQDTINHHEDDKHGPMAPILASPVESTRCPGRLYFIS